MSEEFFYGTFKVGKKEYRVIEADYDAIPDDVYEKTPLVDLIKIAKEFAIQRIEQEEIFKEGRRERQQANESILRDIDVEDPLSRFVGRILIFDGNNLAYRCRHKFDLHHNGENVSVIFGSIRSIYSAMKRFKSDCVIVCWDGGIPQYRFKAVPEYKQQRDHSKDEDWEEFKFQLKKLQYYLPQLGILSIRQKNVEADDLVYHATRMLHADYQKIVVSTDNDLLQCIRFDTMVWSPIKCLEITHENFDVNGLIGIKFADYLTYKALVGDSSDNIPGCKGVGEKTAVKLISNYSSPSNMLNVANGLNSEVAPMADGIAKKLRKFGLKGFGDTMTAIRLDYDKCGARLALLNSFNRWRSYDHKSVKQFLMSYAFQSLQDPDFYDAFKALKSPLGILTPEIGYKLRFPVMPPLGGRLGVSKD